MRRIRGGRGRRIARRASPPPDPMNSRETAAYGRIIQVFLYQSGFEIVSGPPACSGYPANGRPVPGEGTTYQPGHPIPNRNVPRCTATGTGAPGPPPAGSQHPNGCLHVVEYSGHGVSPLAGEASSPHGATDRGRSSCPNQASHGSIRKASATRVRSNAPGTCSNCLKQRPTRLRENPSCHPSRYIRPYRTSIAADLFRSVYWVLRRRRAPSGYFTKYQFSGLMLSVGLCGLTPLRLLATSVRE